MFYISKFIWKQNNFLYGIFNNCVNFGYFFVFSKLFVRFILLSLQLKMWKQNFGSCDGKAVLMSPFLVFCKKKWSKVMAVVQSELRSNDQLQQEIDNGTVNKTLILEKKCKQKLIEEWRLLSDKKHHR